MSKRTWLAAGLLGVMSLGGAVVFDEGNRRVHPNGELANESVVSAGISEDPTAAMDIEDRRKWTGGADGLDDAHWYIACACRNRDPLFIGIELWNGGGLNIVQNLPGGRGSEIVEERRLRSRLRDLLGCVLQSGRLHW